MSQSRTFGRREFLRQAGYAAAGLTLIGNRAAAAEKPGAPDIHTLTVISGKPRERGRLYGKQFRDGIHAFLDNEIYAGFDRKPNPKDEMLRFAAACGKEVKSYAPLIHDEMEGIAEGSGLKLEEVVLISNHEELWHRGVIKAADHCTVFGAAPPDTADGDTFVCQTWDWMGSVFGKSRMLHWKRPEGPSLLAYSYPGLWVGAGLNSSGIALCWHTGGKGGVTSPRVGIPD